MTDSDNIKHKAKRFAERLEAACEGVIYLSETDAEIRPFAARQANKGVRAAVLKEVGELGKTAVEERSFDTFFRKLTISHDWYGDAEKENTFRFVELRKLLEKNLKDLIVLRFGRVRIDIFVVGIDADGNIAGVRTSAVET